MTRPASVASRWLLSLLVAVALFGSTEAPADVVKWRQVTAGGELRIVQLDERTLGCTYEVTLRDALVLRTNCDDESSTFADFPVPAVVEHFGVPLPPFDDVVLMQQNTWGKACTGGPLWFLGIRTDGTFERSPEIPFCGGPAPVVRREGTKVTVVVPGSAPNRGPGFIHEERWVYENGRLERMKPRRASGRRRGCRVE